MNSRIKRFAATGAIAVALPVGMLATTATSASAQTGMTIKNPATGLCLEADNSPFDVNAVFARGCNGAAGQSWTVSLPGTVMNVGNGGCLEARWDGPVVTSMCDDANPFQQWRASGDGLRNLVTGRCLQVFDDGFVATQECNSGQQWTIS